VCRDRNRGAGGRRETTDGESPQGTARAARTESYGDQCERERTRLGELGFFLLFHRRQRVRLALKGGRKGTRVRSMPRLTGRALKGRRGVKKRDDATMGKVLERDEPAGVRPAKRVARGPVSRAGIETEGWADLKDGRSP
jgi:hypothetical protein